MKKLLMMMVLVASVLMANAKETLISHKSFGAKAAYEVNLTNDTVAFTPRYTITGYQFAVDTNVVIQANVTKANPGNLLFFEIEADSTKRYVTFDTNFIGVGATDSLNIAKTRLWGFLYMNGKFVQINRSAEY
jgi:hypothetical protein